MYIGEISKPSVERSEIKPKPKLPVTSPVEAMLPVTDKVDLSSKAKRRYQEYQKKHQHKKNNNSHASHNETTQDNVEIDIDDLKSNLLLKHNAHSKGFEPPSNIDYSYLVTTEHEIVVSSKSPSEIKIVDETDERSAMQTHIDLNA
ncbi:MAG: hypothetical protein Q9M92_06160 [Enterobacterales bacterium]|nr:hypothetical protein [Enterobacterales bacterium]